MKQPFKKPDKIVLVSMGILVLLLILLRPIKVRTVEINTEESRVYVGIIDCFTESTFMDVSTPVTIREKAWAPITDQEAINQTDFCAPPSEIKIKTYLLF